MGGKEVASFGERANAAAAFKFFTSSMGELLHIKVSKAFQKHVNNPPSPYLLNALETYIQFSFNMATKDQCLTCETTVSEETESISSSSGGSPRACARVMPKSFQAKTGVEVSRK